MLEIIRFEDHVDEEPPPGSSDSVRREFPPFDLQVGRSRPGEDASGSSDIHDSADSVDGAADGAQDRVALTALSADASLSAHSVALARRFVEEMVLESLERRRLRGPGPFPEFDWEALWAAARGAQSLEEAVGRVVLRAHRLAAEIREDTSDPDDIGEGVPLAPATSDVEFGSRADGQRASQVDLPAAPVQPPPLAVQPPPLAVQPPPLAVQPPPLAVQPPPPPVERIPITPALEDDEIGLSLVVPETAGRPRDLGNSRRRRWLASFFGWVQFSGILLCLFVGWQLWGTAIAQHHAQEALKQEFHAAVQRAAHRSTDLSSTDVSSRAPTLVAAEVRLPEPPEGSVVAHLQIPSIGVDEYVVEGTAEADLDKGPGHYVGTAMPGQEGNVAIAGHRTTYGAPFYNLNKLTPGDTIILTTDSGEQLHYVESQVPFAVSPSDVSVLNYFGDNRLTLTTCNPKYSSSQRLVAVAVLQTPVAAPAPTRALVVGRSGVRPSGLNQGLAISTVGWHLSHLPEALLLLALLIVLGVANSRASEHLGRRLRWLVLVPVWVGVIYVLFGVLTSLLPATL